MKNKDIWDFYSDVETEVLLTSKDTDEFLDRMIRVDYFFNNCDIIMNTLNKTIINFNINDYVIENKSLFNKIKFKLCEWIRLSSTRT